MEDLTQLPNIGEVLAQLLNQVGVETYQDLVDLGSVEAAHRIEATGHFVGYNMLYALEGAVRGIRWHGIPKEERKQLWEKFEQGKKSK